MNNYLTESIKLIKKFEGFSAKAYMCPAGLPTIGYGHLIKKSEKFDCITEYEAEELLHEDIERVRRGILNNIYVTLQDNHMVALISFTFNLGVGALQRSTLRQKINREEHEEVPRELMRWVYAGGKILKGLILRRRAEAEMYSDSLSLKQ